MQHCTNCGAAAREGARFCTSCGVRLDPVTASSSATATDQPETTATYTAVSDESPAEPDAPAADTDAPAASERVTEDAGGTISYEESWPDADAEAAATEAEAPPEAAPAAIEHWPEPEPNAPQAEDAGDTDTVPPSWDAGAADDADTAAGANRDHDGPSGWEGWAPTPSPESAVQHHESDGSLDDLRDLVGTLKARLDRLATTTGLRARGVEADELAEQLNGWVADGPASDDLLDVVRAVRQNPRDLDALTRLADRAEELEQLVERYGSMCSDAERWVARLRDHDAAPPA